MIDAFDRHDRDAMTGGVRRGIEDRFEDVPIRVRFLWTEITAASARWARAFSVDGGTTWETNWTMHLERVA